MIRLSKGCSTVPQCLTCSSALLPPRGYRSLRTCQGSLTRFQQLCRAELYYPPQPRHMPLSFHSWLTTAELRLAGCTPSPRVARPRTAIANRCTSPFRCCCGLFMLSGDSPGGAFRGDFLYFPSRHVYNQSPRRFGAIPILTHGAAADIWTGFRHFVVRWYGYESCPTWRRHIIKDSRFVDFCGLCPDNTTVRRGRITREAQTGDSEGLVGRAKQM